MNASGVFGCGVAALYGFNHFDPWRQGSEARDAIKKELDRWIADPGKQSRENGNSYLHPHYVRKFIAVVTSGQKEALAVLMEHPRARLLFKTMNYMHMNYCFEITTDNCKELPKNPPHLAFKKREKVLQRKGTRSSTVWKSHANNKTST